MKTANSLLMDLEEQMNMIGLPLMALKLDELYRSSDFLTMDRLEMVSSLLKPEYEDKTTKRFNNLYISEELTIPHDQSDHLSRRFRSLISERDSRQSKSFL